MLRKSKIFISGIIMGAIVSIGITSFAANELIKVYKSNELLFKFNGIYKELPEEYTTLIYNNRTYIPARFVAESLGVEVNFDENTKTTSFEIPKVIPKPITEEDCKEFIEKYKKENEELREEIKKLKEANNSNSNDSSSSYSRMPQDKSYKSFKITLQDVDLNKNDIYSKVFVKLENKSSDRETVKISAYDMYVEADGKTYKAEKVPFIYFDQKVFGDLYRDEVYESYIPVDKIPDETKEMKVKIVVKVSDSIKTWDETMEFYVKK